jgi:hypothetical protein
MAADIYHSISRELPPEDPSDITKTELFQKLRATEAAPNPLAEQRQAQCAFDEVLSKLGTRAVAPVSGESPEHYLAVLAQQAAAFGPEERKQIDRQSLAAVSPAALAEVARQDLEFARSEIEHPKHSLKDGEVREVVKIDRAGHQITEFYTKDNSPSFWMDMFKGDVVSMVSGGSKGFATEDRSGCYRFDKSNFVPELIEAQRQAEYMDSAEYKIAEAYRAVGREPPGMSKLRR